MEPYFYYDLMHWGDGFVFIFHQRREYLMPIYESSTPWFLQGQPILGANKRSLHVDHCTPKINASR